MGPLSRLHATRRRTATLGLVALVALGVGMLSGCGSSSATLPGGVVAQVGDTQITTAQLDTYMSQLAASATSQGQAFPTPGTASYTTAQQQALQQLIQLQIVGFEAAKCGKPCAVSNAEITAQLNTLAQQRFGGSQAKLVAYLRTLGFTLNQARDQVKAGLEQQKLQNYVERGVTYTPAEAQAYYASHASQFNVPETRVVSHILVQNAALANKIRAEATPANFAALARQYSTDTGSKAQGGNLGAIQASQVVAPFAKAAFALKVGQISQPVHSQYGWHIIYVTKVTPAHHTSEAAALQEIISSQLASKRATAYQHWVAKTLAFWNAQTKYASSSLEPSSSASGASSTG